MYKVVRACRYDLSSQTDGNPFFVREVLAQLHESGRAIRSADLAVTGVPDTVKMMIRRRLERLGQSATEILASGSLILDPPAWFREGC